MDPRTTPVGRILLKRGRTKPVAMHHPWVFEATIGKIDGNPGAGDLVSVHDHVGRFIGQGYFSPESKIPVKLFSWTEGETIDAAFWRERLKRAVELRTTFLQMNDPASGVRLVNSEGDGVPGLVVDRYGGFLVVGFLTVGMAARADLFADILCELTEPAGVFERPEPEISRLEGISRTPQTLCGEEPPECIEIVEGPAKFLVDVRHGQKSGFYLDQRENRLRAGELASGRRVLDAFCYTGGFAVQAALGGAASVTAVDSSASSLELAGKNAELNGVEVAFVRGNAFERLRMLHLEGETFDMVIIDPPRLARSRAGVTKALRAYKDANLSALKLLDPGGILVTCCCSGLVSEQDFLRALNDAAVDAARSLSVIERRGASPDHPFSPACPETDYLQCLISRLSD
ncbi:MAG: hypothetical protein AMS16_06400 [Planctomycetes bacterium DG_58]|nr:MAG: hypothetical protein AMS16_06400 [Planctomycetes bacterium DG_58]